MIVSHICAYLMLNDIPESIDEGIDIPQNADKNKILIGEIKNKKNNGGGQGGDPYDNYNRNYNGRSSGYNGGGYYR